MSCLCYFLLPELRRRHANVPFSVLHEEGSNYELALFAVNIPSNTQEAGQTASNTALSACHTRRSRDDECITTATACATIRRVLD